MSDVLLEVVVLHADDAQAAHEGGADRLVVAGADGLSPATTTVSSVVRSTDLPVRALLRLDDRPSTHGAELTRIVALAEASPPQARRAWRAGSSTVISRWTPRR